MAFSSRPASAAGGRRPITRPDWCRRAARSWLRPRPCWSCGTTSAAFRLSRSRRTTMSADRCKSDGEVARDVTNVLNAHAALRALPITTEVLEGCVTISGTVRTWKDARDACRLARTVDGVVRSRRDLVVDPVPAERRTDQELALAASDAIRDNLLIRADIRVTAKDGVVTLEGTVPYPSQRYAAAAALERVRGLRGVVTLVGVHHLGDEIRSSAPHSAVR